ncbi:MAG: hypothetical protein ACKO5K_11360 [Armatimonadota bacterium]
MNEIIRRPASNSSGDLARRRVFTRFRKELFESNLIPPVARWVVGLCAAAALGAAIALSIPLRFPDAVVPSENEIGVLAELHRTRAMHSEPNPRTATLRRDPTR